MAAPAPVPGQTDLLLSPEDGTSRFGTESFPAVAALPGGGFVAIWSDFLPSSANAPPGYPAGQGFDADGGTTIMVRRFAADGTALGQAKPVTADLSGNAGGSHVVALSNGNIAIGWDVAVAAAPGSSRIGAVILDPATGNVVGGDLVPLTGPGVASAENAVFVQMLALSGGRAGALFVDRAGADRLRLSIIEADGSLGATSTLLTEGTAFLPALGTTDIAAVLAGPNQDVIAIPVRVNSGPGMGSTQLRFFNADGSAAAIPTASGFSNDGFAPAVSALPGGGFVTAVRDFSAPSGTSFILRRHDAAGAVIGSPTTVAFPYLAFSNDPELIGLPDGGAIIAMSGVNASFNASSIYAQRIAADGGLDGGIVELDVAPNGFQTRPQLALTTTNDLIAVWEDARSQSNPEMRAARFDLGSFPGDAMTLNGAGAAETLDGDAGNDLISGRGGDDLLRGAAGRDTILGGGGADTMDGGENDDLLRGGLGNDLLIGGAGNDFLDGGTQADTLEGGAGADRLYGGAGNDGDVFVWRALAESAFAAPDRVQDWGPGDVLDLSAIDADPTTPGDDAFAYVGNAGFSGGLGNAQVRWVNAGANTIVLVDGPDADRIAEMRIIITGIHSLSAEDFML
jgi:hypothetical protein